MSDFDGALPFIPFLQAVVRVSALNGDLFPQVPDFVLTVLHDDTCSFGQSEFCSCQPKIQACYFPKPHVLAVWPEVQWVWPDPVIDRGAVYVFTAGGKNE